MLVGFQIKLMRTSFYIFILGFFILQSCEKEKVDPFNQEYFYYTFNFEKIQLYLNGSEVYIEFNHNLSYVEIVRFLSKYDFLKIPAASNSTARTASLKCRINAEDTTQLVNILRVLNQDTIHYAVPIFTLTKNDPKSFAIPLNEIVCDPLVSEEELIKTISKYDLLITKSKPEHLYYLLEIKRIHTGFEPLKISNSLYETEKFIYCCPNMLSAFMPLD
jgi:hypothetical protein